MGARIYDRQSNIFYKADSRSALARQLYKKYADRSIRHTPLFKQGDSVFIWRPLTQSKPQKEKESNTSRSNLRFRAVGPFKVVDATPHTVTIFEDGTLLKVSIDRYVRDPGPEDEARQEKPNPYTIPSFGNPRSCLLYTSPSPRDQRGSRMPSSA